MYGMEYLKKGINKMENVQRRATKLVKNMLDGLRR